MKATHSAQPFSMCAATTFPMHSPTPTPSASVPAKPVIRTESPSSSHVRFKPPFNSKAFLPPIVISSRQPSESGVVPDAVPVAMIPPLETPQPPMALVSENVAERPIHPLQLRCADPSRRPIYYDLGAELDRVGALRRWVLQVWRNWAVAWRRGGCERDGARPT